MANVKITDLTSKAGALDGTELIEIVHDPSGAPASRKVTTQQVANILGSHATTHESGGSDEVDHDAMTLNVDPTKQHVNSTPTTGQTGTQILESAYITGSTKKFDVSPVEMITVNTGPDVSGSSYLPTVCVSSSVMYYCGDDDVLRSVDLASCKQIQSVAGVNNTALIYDAPYVYDVRTTTVDRYDEKDLSIKTSFTATGSSNLLHGCLRTSDNKFYGIDVSQSLKSIERTMPNYTVVSIRTLTEMVNNCRHIVVDVTGNYFYVADFPFTGGSGYIRKFNTSGVHQYSSTAILTDNGKTASIFVRDDGLVGVSHNGDFEYFNDSGSSFSLVSTHNGSATNSKLIYSNGLLYGATEDASSFNFITVSPPALTVETPAAADFSATPDVRFSNGLSVVTASQLVDSKLKIDSQDRDRLGCTVLSVETTIPGSPAIGDTYLMSGGTSIYEGYVIRWTAQGEWEVLARGAAATVFESTRGIYHDYIAGQWVPRVDTVIRGTVTIPSGTGVGTWTSSHLQFNAGNPMMLNTDDVLMLECDYKIISRSSTSRGYLHRSNRIDIAPEYQVNSYADDISHGFILNATTASSYVNIDAETTPDKSGIVYAEIVVEIPTLTTAYIELEYVIRLKGEPFADAGTYDC